MAKISGTFDQLWTSDMESKAKALGVIDGDLHRVRASVKNLLVTAGWAANDGSLSFTSETDRSNAITASMQVLTSTAQRTAAERRVTVAPRGSTPTKASILQASAAAPPQSASFSSASPVRVASFPALAKVGDRCPRCNGNMDPVGLVNDRGALYCPRDRVVLPLSPDVSVR